MTKFQTIIPSLWFLVGILCFTIGTVTIILRELRK